MTDRRTFSLTTAIPYVNAKPHLGHALEYIQTDLIARHQRQLGKEVFFLSGADENSLKNVQAAEKEGISTRELVDRNTQGFIDLLAALEVSTDDFIRTVSEKHFNGVQKLWSACRPEDIYKKSYKGLYCVGCEAFYTPDELVDGKCPEHKTVPETIEEENYFFRLSAWQEELERRIASDELRIIPEFRKNEVLSFIRGGLQDFSISRSQARARNWGIPVPGDDGQVVYVWFDALGNYITALDYAAEGGGEGERFKKYWPCDLHVIGKGIIRFHAVYWPAMLLSAGVELPRGLFVHGYVTVEGEKMSKSLGAVVDPAELVVRYGVEPVRYYLARYIHPVQDSDFSIAALEQAYTSDLANGIGNLLSRSLTMIEKQCAGEIIPVPLEGDGPFHAAARAVRAKLEETFTLFENHMAGYEFDRAFAKVWEGVAALDKFINDGAPWSLAKDPARRDDLLLILYVCAEGLRMLAALIAPAMPKTAAEIWRRIGLHRAIDDVPWATQRQWGQLTAGLKIDKGTPLFPRLEPRKED